MDHSWLQLVNKLLRQPRCGNLVETIWNFDYPAAAKWFKTATDALGLSGLQPCTQHVAVVPASLVWGFSALCKKSKNEVGGTTLSLARSTSWTRSRAGSQTHDGKVFPSRVRWIWIPVKKGQIIWFCVAVCSTPSLVPGMT